ncbi:hypothetical protein D3C87_1902560 [compost metagenome]
MLDRQYMLHDCPYKVASLVVAVQFQESSSEHLVQPFALVRLQSFAQLLAVAEELLQAPQEYFLQGQRGLHWLKPWELLSMLSTIAL